MKVEIKNHLLFIDDKQVAFKKTPNISAYKNKLQYLIEHYTATYGASSPISWLADKDSQVSAHLVIDKEGVVTQLAPFDAVCWHAGASTWKGLNGMNQYSIGIEIVNSGILSPKGGKYYSADGHEVTSYQRLKNKLGLQAVWENYPDKQIDTVAAVSKALQSHYSLKEIIGHEDVSPGRKTDPGPAFPWDKIRSQASVYVAKTTTAELNLRAEPNPLGKVIKVLPKGMNVKVLKQEGEWTFTGDGWVSTKYLK
jgi:N-acetylmuramoyl-L-alanine amidase